MRTPLPHLLAAFLALAGCAEAPVDTGLKPETLQSRRITRAVILIIDGVRWDESFSAQITPVTGGTGQSLMPKVNHQLVPSAALCRQAMSAGVTITAPGHHDLVTGVRAEHGNYPNDHGAGAYRPELPTLFEEARIGLGLVAEDVVLLGNTTLIEAMGHGLRPGGGEPMGATWDFIHAVDDPSKPAQQDSPVVDAVREHLASGARIIMANLHDADRAGHFGIVDAYPRNVQLQDSDIADLWSEISRDPELAADTALIVLADHGRHRDNPDEEGWREHGDHCAGCRQVPLLVLGPGIEGGVIHDTPIFMEDVSQTIAWWMGFDLPYGTGRVLTELFSDPAAIAELPTPVHGTVRVQQIDQLRAREVHTGEPTERSRIRVGDATLSDPAARAAEAPVLASSEESSALCHRELHVDPDDDLWPWLGRCHLRTGRVWVDIGTPTAIVNPHWRPALHLGPGNVLHMIHADNPNGIVAKGKDPTAVRWTRWSPALGWRGMGAGISDISLPTDPAMALRGREAWIAFAASPLGGDGRASRHIQIHQGSWPSDANDPSFTPLHDTLDLRFGGEPIARMERPVIRVQESRLELAFLAVLADGQVAVLTIDSSDGGDSWGEPMRADFGGGVYPHIGPRHTADGALIWAQPGDDGQVEICSSSPQAGCHHTGKDTIRSLEPTSTGAIFTSRGDEQAWAAHTVDL
jgi:hypothetical protein